VGLFCEKAELCGGGYGRMYYQATICRIPPKKPEKPTSSLPKARSGHKPNAGRQSANSWCTLSGRETAGSAQKAGPGL